MAKTQGDKALDWNTLTQIKAELMKKVDHLQSTERLRNDSASEVWRIALTILSGKLDKVNETNTLKVSEFAKQVDESWADTVNRIVQEHQSTTAGKELIKQLPDLRIELDHFVSKTLGSIDTVADSQYLALREEEKKRGGRSDR